MILSEKGPHVCNLCLHPVTLISTALFWVLGLLQQTHSTRTGPTPRPGQTGLDRALLPVNEVLIIASTLRYRALGYRLYIHHIF